MRGGEGSSTIMFTIFKTFVAKIFMCILCQKIYNKSMYVHLVPKHLQQKYVCASCAKTFTTKVCMCILCQNTYNKSVHLVPNMVNIYKAHSTHFSLSIHTLHSNLYTIAPTKNDTVLNVLNYENSNSKLMENTVQCNANY